MGKGRPRAVEKGALGHAPGGGATASSVSTSSSGVVEAPVFYPTEEEFVDPLAFIYKIRPQAEPFGICRIVPPRSWNPPFALDRSAFTFPTKSQDIHLLQARPPSCDPDTFRLEYGRFLESHLGKRSTRRVVFEGEDLDLCRLFNAVKRYGGYDKVCAGKLWADVARFIRPASKISECAKHVLCQIYREHLYDFEEYNRRLNRGIRKNRSSKPSMMRKTLAQQEAPGRKRRKRGVGCDRLKEVVKKEELDQICEQCKSGLHGEVMLLCDRCDKGWHLYCLSPPLQSIPPGNWYCLECVNSDKDSFGFVPGKLYTVDAFRLIDDRMKRKWFGQTIVSRVQMEKQFWEIVEGRGGELEVMYGNDLDTSLYGSGFPRPNDPIPSSVDPSIWNQYISSPWNLNNLPKLPGSMLRSVRENIAGVMVPWLYIGMLFSSFCWHVEDHCFYSINYLHWGEPKCWYGVPGNKANAFEEVMRKALPDLFEAQPDLLFQLVTMLNPSILLENGVQVYGVLQEPGNFVITFPRSFHGGFNFGLNCAEAVNFAPADWLPHGGIGSELYRLYHKAAVLSHEELLCVAIKNGCDAKAFSYLKEEMQRVFDREKKCREELWVNGIVRSLQMHPKKHPHYVGTEEDPTCVICRQYLYLSAVSCSCRPSTIVCLEHWEHLCECKPNKLRLLYRHTLAELGDLIDMVSPNSKLSNVDEILPLSDGFSQGCRSYNGRSSAMTKKVKGCEISYLQLAKDWFSQSCHILESPFSDSTYNSSLTEAEQFLWADHDMDPVRDMTFKLIEAQRWARNLNSCLFKVESSEQSPHNHYEKVTLSELENLLSFQILPCCLPDFHKLKAVVGDAETLVTEIQHALSSSSTIGTLQMLYSKATNFPVSLQIVERLSLEISSAKNWLKNAHLCLKEKRPDVINIDILNKIKLEMLELHVNFPEMDMLSRLCDEVESWRIRCKDMLRGYIRMKELKDFLVSTDHLTVSIPELDLLRKYSSDARSWVCHLQGVLQNLDKREDYGNIVIELSCILKSGYLLHVQVDELPLVVAELKRSKCRKNASKALSTPMPLGFLQRVLYEASKLKIENEQLFVNVSKMLTEAIAWEEGAKAALEHVAHISVFEKILTDSDAILVGLPSLPNIRDAVSMAKMWISRSLLFLKQTPNANTSQPLLRVDDLKDLVAQTKHLKVTMVATDKLQSIVAEVEGWEQDSCCLLENVKSLFDTCHSSSTIDNHLSTKIEELLRKIESSIEVGDHLCYNFKDLPNLKVAAVSLRWCLTAISFCYRIPLLKDVDRLLDEANHLPVIFLDSHLVQLLNVGVNWLRKALCTLPELNSTKRCKLKDVELVLDEIQEVIVPYPMMVTQIQNAIRKHESWVGQVHAYFALPKGQPWPSLLKLKKHGEAAAFMCSELDKVASEVGKVENWLSQCHAILEPVFGNLGSLTSRLVQIKDSLDRALRIYHDSKGQGARGFCVCCPNYGGNEEVYTCLICNDQYHFSCVGPPLANASMTNEYACPLCVYVENGALPRNESQLLFSKGNRPEVKSFFELVSAASDIFARIEELNLVERIVERACECKSFLSEIVKSITSHYENDLSSISENILIALKAITVTGIHDPQGCCNLESVLTRYSWKVRVRKLLAGSKKPVLSQLQRVMKEGTAMGITSEDHLMKEITDMKQISLQWVDIAKKVASDSGKLALSEVYKLIIQGEDLPLHFEKELKLLRERTLLYCICRMPNDQRAMIACDQCDEWYHFECVNLHEPPPKTFYCPACQPTNGVAVSLPYVICSEERSNNEAGPNTPACHRESKHIGSRINYGHSQDAVELLDVLRSHNGIDQLWRENRRPFHRTTRRRAFPIYFVGMQLEREEAQKGRERGTIG
ncbi:lysine-specific demethylase 5B-like isoform X1 [Zingiber officinale]|uniref:lysine-specific demethylase 5B-like isoform X1 n=1 Tax=Zingiber officinale TaxID=94328 RepID=UPI001C4BED25|nr:lysine-specific demethylase 5B-like isoform X1 [Zingiber officinale]